MARLPAALAFLAALVVYAGPVASASAAAPPLSKAHAERLVRQVMRVVVDGTPRHPYRRCARTSRARFHCLATFARGASYYDGTIDVYLRGEPWGTTWYYATRLAHIDLRCARWGLDGCTKRVRARGAQVDVEKVRRWAYQWCVAQPGITIRQLYRIMGRPTGEHADQASWDALDYEFNAFFEGEIVGQLDVNDFGLSDRQRAAIGCESVRKLP